MPDQDFTTISLCRIQTYAFCWKQRGSFPSYVDAEEDRVAAGKEQDELYTEICPTDGAASRVEERNEKLHRKGLYLPADHRSYGTRAVED